MKGFVPWRSTCFTEKINVNCDILIQNRKEFKMDWLLDLAANYILISGATAWLVAQLLKCVTGVFKLKKFSLVELLFGTGGMPSSHSAAVCALTTACGIIHGLDSAEFAISAVLAIIVMRDAMGMRREVGKHAKALNVIFEEFFKSERHSEDIKKTQKELVGHTPLQVFAGAGTGVIVALLMSLIPGFMIW